jgi:Carboxypeptidase regulatory-like domain
LLFFDMKNLVALVLSLLVVASFGQASGANRMHLSQKFRSGISGRITDPNGAVVVGAKITIVSRSSQAIVSRKSNTEGAYAINLDPDTYDVSVEAWGFKKATRKSIQVVRGSRPHVDFVLELAPPVNAPKVIN